MAKMTKTQMRKSLHYLKSRAKNLFLNDVLSVADYQAISKISNKGMNKLK